MISETPTPLKQNRPLKIRLQRVSRMVGYPTLRIFLSFAINPAIAFGTPRDKQTNFVPARCAAKEGNWQHSPVRTFKPSVTFSNAGNSHLPPVLMALMSLVFLSIEGRRFRYFDIWR